MRKNDEVVQLLRNLEVFCSRGMLKITYVKIYNDDQRGFSPR